MRKRLYRLSRATSYFLELARVHPVKGAHEMRRPGPAVVAGRVGPRVASALALAFAFALPARLSAQLPLQPPTPPPPAAPKPPEEKSITDIGVPQAAPPPPQPPPPD